MDGLERSLNLNSTVRRSIDATATEYFAERMTPLILAEGEMPSLARTFKREIWTDPPNVPSLLRSYIWVAVGYEDRFGRGLVSAKEGRDM